MTITPPGRSGPVEGLADPGDLVTSDAYPDTFYVLKVHPHTAPYRYTIADTETGQTVHTNLRDPSWKFVD